MKVCWAFVRTANEGTSTLGRRFIHHPLILLLNGDTMKKTVFRCNAETSISGISDMFVFRRGTAHHRNFSSYGTQQAWLFSKQKLLASHLMDYVCLYSATIHLSVSFKINTLLCVVRLKTLVFGIQLVMMALMFRKFEEPLGNANPWESGFPGLMEYYGFQGTELAAMANC